MKRNKKGQFIKGVYYGYGFKKGQKAHLGFKHTPETIEKMRKHCGHPVSEATKEKIKRATKGQRVREKNPMWKGGKYKTKSGYIQILINGIYKLEHREKIEKLLGRALEEYEHVHHLNGIKNDNRLENLKIVINKEHYGEIRCPKCLYDFLIK